MNRSLILLAFASLLFGADNPWTKVQELKSRAELRIYKKGVAEPVNAVFFEATDDKVIVVVKNAQVAIAKDDIDRLDARPAGKTARTVTREAKVTPGTPPDTAPQPPHGVDVPKDSWSTGMSIGGGSKPDFETIYKRPNRK